MKKLFGSGLRRKFKNFIKQTRHNRIDCIMSNYIVALYVCPPKRIIVLYNHWSAHALCVKILIFFFVYALKGIPPAWIYYILAAEKIMFRGFPLLSCFQVYNPYQRVISIIGKTFQPFIQGEQNREKL